MYKKILVALDFSPESEAVGRRAAELAERCGAQVSLIHVVEFMPMDLGDGMMPVEPMGLDEELEAQARERMTRLAERLGLKSAPRRLEVGATRGEVIRAAEEEGVDLIVVGSHERHGLALLLGSTANAILHHAPCDVLAVRIHDG
ncbi:universal stress protein [Endothiovibrio diazotrophicus]